MRQFDLSGFTPEPVPPPDAGPNAAIIDGTLAQALERDPSLPMDLEQSLAALEAGHAAATAQNSADWPDDASQRATNQHFIDVAFGRRKRQAAETQADLDQRVSDWISEPGQLERPPLAMWALLTADERPAIDQTLA
jgi:hypothetical protein